MTQEELDQFFMALLAQNEYLGLVGLGKVKDPSTDTSTVDLQKTAIAIGTLEMLERKTRGNLLSVEESELRRILTTLRLNYVEEAKKPGGGAEAPSEQPTEQQEDTTGDREVPAGE